MGSRASDLRKKNQERQAQSQRMLKEKLLSDLFEARLEILSALEEFFEAVAAAQVTLSAKEGEASALTAQLAVVRSVIESVKSELQANQGSVSELQKLLGENEGDIVDTSNSLLPAGSVPLTLGEIMAKRASGQNAPQEVAATSVAEPTSEEEPKREPPFRL